MAEWGITIPHRSRDAFVTEVAIAADEVLSGEDRIVTRQLAHDAIERGVLRVGALLDELEAAGQAGRRQILDRARERAGLEGATAREDRIKFEAAQEVARRRHRPRPIPECPVCGRRPTGAGGMPVAVSPVRRWHCPDHVDQAEPGDMEAPSVPIGPNFGYFDPDEVAADQRDDERRQRAQLQRLDERRERGEERARVERARQERFAADLPAGFR